MKTYNVYMPKRKLIDKVFADLPFKSKKEREEGMKKSLVEHDCYNPNIIVKEHKF